MATAKQQKILAHFKQHDPVLYGAILNPEQFVLTRRNITPFESLCRTIAGQQLSVKAAASIYAKFEKLFRGGITPQKVLRVSDEKLRGVGFSRAKVLYIKDLARHFNMHDLTKEQLQKMNDEEVMQVLLPVHGIGVWSVEMFLIFYLRREDVFSLGDLGLMVAIRKLYKMKSNPSKETATRMSKAWSPYRSYACRILWDSLNNEPQ